MWPPCPTSSTRLTIWVRKGGSMTRRVWSTNSSTARSGRSRLCVVTHCTTNAQHSRCLYTQPPSLWWTPWSMVVVDLRWIYVSGIRCIYDHHKHNYSCLPSSPQYEGVAESTCDDDNSCLWEFEGPRWERINRKQSLLEHLSTRIYEIARLHIADCTNSGKDGHWGRIHYRTQLQERLGVMCNRKKTVHGFVR